MKQCSKCKQIKPLLEFYQNKKHRDKLEYACKECTKKQVTIYRNLHKEDYKNYFKKCYQQNPEKFKKRKAEDYQINKEKRKQKVRQRWLKIKDTEQYKKYCEEYQRKYNKENPKKRKEQRIKWYNINKNYNRIYYQQNTEKIKTSVYGYQKNNPLKRLAWSHNHRVRFLEAGKLTGNTIQLVYEDNIKKYGTLTCIYCLQPIPFGKDTLEHKMPLIRGGTNNYNNLAIACRSCNSSKQDKTEEEYKQMEVYHATTTRRL